MVLLTFVWKCFQDRNFHGAVVGLYEQSIESGVGLTFNLLEGLIFCMETMNLEYESACKMRRLKSPIIAHNRQTRPEPRASNAWYMIYNKGAISYF